MKSNKKIFIRIIGALIIAVLFALTVYAAIAIGGKSYELIYMLVALCSCVPFFFRFERLKNTPRELAVIAVMTALSVVGRVVFMEIPAFKPITALIVITGIAFGTEAGFVTGSLSALISNIFFGQGPWTPFQMLSWGIIGFLSGLLHGRKKVGVIWLIILGIIAGAGFSLMMDIWTAISYDGKIILSRYFVFIGASLPFMLTYVISNIVFLLLLANPMMKQTTRIKEKYGIFLSDADKKSTP